MASERRDIHRTGFTIFGATAGISYGATLNQCLKKYASLYPLLGNQPARGLLFSALLLTPTIAGAIYGQHQDDAYTSSMRLNQD